jgi:hypothetical protein
MADDSLGAVFSDFASNYFANFLRLITNPTTTIEAQCIRIRNVEYLL